MDKNKLYINFYEDSVEEIKGYLNKINDSTFSLKIHHYSSSIDDEINIKKYGLQSLNEQIRQKDSPLNIFLKEHEIILSITNNLEISYKGKKMELKDSTLKSKFSNNSDTKFIHCLAFGDKNYSSCCRYGVPEILSSIEKYISENFYDKVNLCKAWLKKSKNNIILYTFEINESEMIGNILEVINEAIHIKENNFNDYIVLEIKGPISYDRMKRIENK